MPLVLYEVACSDGPVVRRKGSQSAEVLAFRHSRNGDLNLATLREVFPERGSFHFRVKTLHPNDPKKTVWQDLVNDSDSVPRSPDGGPPHVKALPLFYDSEPEEEINEGIHLSRSLFEISETTEDHSSAFTPFHSPPKQHSPVEMQEPKELQAQQASDDFIFDSQDNDDMDFFFSSSSAQTESQQTTESKKTPRRRESETSKDSESESSDSSSSSNEEVVRRTTSRKQNATRQESGVEVGGVASSYLQSFGKSAETFKKSAFGASVSSFFKKSAQAAMNLAAGAEGLPNTQQASALTHLHRKLTEETFDPDNGEHAGFLKACWKAAFPSASFVPSGSQWCILGFSNEDPTKDPLIRKTGTLGLHCLSYHMEHTYGKNLKPIEKSNLTLAPAAVKIAVKLCKALSIHDMGFKSSTRQYWGLFDSGIGAFLEIVSATIGIADVQASLGHPEKVCIQFALEQTERILQQGPKSIDGFYTAAKSLGVLFPK